MQQSQNFVSFTKRSECDSNFVFILIRYLFTSISNFCQQLEYFKNFLDLLMAKQFKYIFKKMHIQHRLFFFFTNSFPLIGIHFLVIPLKVREELRLSTIPVHYQIMVNSSYLNLHVFVRSMEKKASELKYECSMTVM